MSGQCNKITYKLNFFKKINTGQDKIGLDRTEKDRIGQDRARNDRAG